MNVTGRWLKVQAEKESVLRSTHTVAVVGLQDNPARPAYGVAQTLIRCGYTIFPVHPAGGTVLGLPVVTLVGALPQRVDLMDVFLNPSRLPQFLDEVLVLPQERQPATLWFQDGAMDEETAVRAVTAGFTVVMTDCTARRLAGMPL